MPADPTRDTAPRADSIQHAIKLAVADTGLMLYDRQAALASHAAIRHLRSLDLDHRMPLMGMEEASEAIKYGTTLPLYMEARRG